MDETKKPWQTLCEQAAKEFDPERLMTLVDEISRSIDEQLSRAPMQHAF